MGRTGDQKQIKRGLKAETDTNIDGIGDDIGFDPLGISNYFPMDYLREAELK